MKKVSLKKLFYIVGLFVFVWALWILQRELRHFEYRNFRDYLGQLSTWHIILAIAGTFFGYICLIGYDWFAIRYIKKKLDLWRVAATAFIGYAFSMNIGQSIISGAAVRMRLYSRWGFSGGEVTKIIGFNTVVTLVGHCLVTGVLFIYPGFDLPEGFILPSLAIPFIGVILLLLVAVFFYRVFTQTKALRIRQWQIDIPPLNITLPAVAVSILDWVIAALVLYELMPNIEGVGPLQFVTIVMAAHTIGILSMVPGGLGVFESVIISLLPDTAPNSEVFAALIAFRAIYYLIPLLLSILLLAGLELRQVSGTRVKSLEKFRQTLLPLVPSFFAIVVFVSGVILLLSGATPTIADRMAKLEKHLPLFAVESAHFLGTIVGISLIILSEALRRKVNLAFWVTACLLGIGIITALVKGFDFEEASILAIVLIAILPFHRLFNRSASLFAYRFQMRWWVALVVVAITFTWIGFLSYQKVHYNPELWTHFGFRGDAQRFLRATAAIAVVISAFGLWQLLRTGPKLVMPICDDESELAKLQPILKNSPGTNGWLALLGDKRLVYSDSGNSFLMFGIQGRTWVAMGDPIGPKEEHEELIWRFHEMCINAGVRTAFYQVSAETAHQYSGLGLQLFNLGENAKVNLCSFTMEGSSRKNLRQTKSKLERLGFQFRVISADKYAEYAPSLRGISDHWKESKNTSEKGFSLGSFNDEYLKRCDFAVIESPEGKVVAFANLWKGTHEVSIDLMRYDAEAPNSVMEFLFIHLLLWGKAEGFECFHLGMAPLSGMENRAHAPLWEKLGASIFNLGDHFYNFQGLRRYKEKFDPDWEPVYLACRNIRDVPSILIDITALVGGGSLVKTFSRSSKNKAKPLKDD